MQPVLVSFLSDCSLPQNRRLILNALGSTAAAGIVQQILAEDLELLMAETKEE